MGFMKSRLQYYFCKIYAQSYTKILYSTTITQNIAYYDSFWLFRFFAPIRGYSYKNVFQYFISQSNRSVVIMPPKKQFTITEIIVNCSYKV